VVGNLTYFFMRTSTFDNIQKTLEALGALDHVQEHQFFQQVALRLGWDVQQEANGAYRDAAIQGAFNGWLLARAFGPARNLPGADVEGYLPDWMPFVRTPGGFARQHLQGSVRAILANHQPPSPSS
jgi:hypothetical protein